MTITYHAGRRIQGLSTDGIDKGWNLTTSTTFDTVGASHSLPSTGTFTWSIWWKPLASHTQSDQLFLERLGSQTNDYFPRIQINAGKLKVTSSTNNVGYGGVVETTNSVNTNQWNHILVKQSGNNITGILNNGTPVTTSVISGNDSGENWRFFYSGSNINSAISNTIMYSTALSSGDITTLYNNGIPISSTNSGVTSNVLIEHSFITTPNSLPNTGSLGGSGNVITGTPTLHKEKPTNVQAGSRFEETDTRKIYYSSTVHSFTSSGTFTPSASGTVEYLVIAGGGAGGNGGGGGAGGYRTGTLPVSAQTYPITVGVGGIGNYYGSPQFAEAGDSIFSTIISTRGGAGAGFASNTQALVYGGSGGGGGGAYANFGISSPVTSPIQGYSGGAYIGGYGFGGGGGSGGAGGQGQNLNPYGNGGAGGVGTTSSITGTAVCRASGGGGGAYLGTGGIGGCSAGSGGNWNPTQATANSGSGGGGWLGGGASVPPALLQSNGGSGIVIIKLTSGSATGGTITTVWTEEA